jgi:hypothetical protein
MGDRTDVYIVFGGCVSPRAAAELVEVLKAEGYRRNECGDEEPSVENLSDSFYANEVNYADIDEIDAVCRQHKINYDMWHGAGGGYGPAMRRYVDGVHMECTCNDEGPLVLLRCILDTETLASGLADLIKLARFMLADFATIVVDDTIVDLVEDDHSAEAESASRGARD